MLTSKSLTTAAMNSRPGKSARSICAHWIAPGVSSSTSEFLTRDRYRLVCRRHDPRGLPVPRRRGRSGGHAGEGVRGVDVFPYLGDASAVQSIQEVVVVQVVVAACGAPLHVRVHGDVVTLGDD